MASTAQPAPNMAPKPKKKKSRSTDPFGGGIPMALVALTVTAIGFFRTFFSQLHNVDIPHLLHGGTSTAWLILVLIQASLIKKRQFKWHRTLGWSSVVLFAALIVTSWQMVALMLSGKSGTPFAFAKLFAYSDLTTLPLLVILYGGAIYLRKDRHVHSRLISATLLVGIIPAAARMFNLVWPGPDGLIFAMHPTFLFLLGVLAIAMAVDWKNDRLRWPFLLTFVWLAVTYATIFPAWQSDWYDQVARAVGATA